VAINLLQIASGLELGINLSGFHDWAADDNPRPGQQSMATSCSFLIAALSALALTALRKPAPRVVKVGRASVTLLFLIALAAIAGYALRIEWLVNWYVFSKMALHTALGLLMVAAALWWRWDALETRDGAEARELRGLVTMALVLTAVIASMTAVAVFRNEGERALEGSLSIARSSMAQGVQTVLSLRSTRASIITTRPLLRNGVHRLAEAPDDREAQAATRLHIEGFLAHGFSYIALIGADGRMLVHVGTPSAAGRPVLALTGLPGGRAELQIGDGFLLRHRGTVDAGDGVRATLVTEQPLAELVAILSSDKRLGNSARSLLCGGGPDAMCASAAGQLVSDTLPPSVAAGSAADTIKRSTDKRLSTWELAGDSGLYLSLSLNSTELYAPVRRGLFWGFLLVGIFTVLAVLLLRSQLAPLVDRLARSEDRYHAVVEGLSEGLMLVDANGRMLAINPAGERMLDIRADQVCGRHVRDLVFEVFDERGERLTFDQLPAMRTLASGIPVLGEVLRVLRTDGEHRWLSVDTTMAGDIGSDATGTRRNVVVSFTDVTDIRRSAELTRQMEQRFRLMIDSISDYGVLMLGLRGEIVSWNPGAERITGYGKEQILGRSYAAFFTDEDRKAGEPQRHLDLAEREGRHESEGWRVRSDGRRIWSNAVTSAMRGDDGQLIGFTKVIRDLSARRAIEQQLADAGRLREAILDSAPFMLISTDVDGVITAFNPAAARMLWYRPEEVIGRTPDRFWDPQEVEARAAELSEELGRRIEPGFDVFVHRPRHGLSEEREWTLIRKDGSRFLASMAVTALRDADGEVNGFLGIAYDITERKRREEYTRHVAHHDFLTGLPNRMLLNDRLAVAMESARRHRSRLAVMMLDLDHFKRINDSLGHHVGDLLLVEVAKRLQQTVRASDTVARLGGDEFVVLLPEPGEDAGVVERLARKIVDAIGAPMILHGQELEVTPSLGVAVFPDDGAHADILMKNADTALYRAKALGRNAYRMFSSDMAKVADQRLNMEAAMRQALKRNEFRLHYQPQVDLDSGAVTGMEALLRWTDPLFGMMSPADFIPVAEECGLILQLGEWVLRTATREAVEIRQRSGHDLRLAVNLSPRQFRQNDLVEMVADALARSGLPAAQLELEITEGALMADTDETQARLKALQALGVSIAIDDFGVGFSSLSYVTRFDIDTLKIDRSFIAALPGSASDAAVARTVIALGQALGIKVVAEGVENDAQLDFLRGHRCDLAQGARFGMPIEPTSFSVQGFHFAAALSPDDFVARLPELAATRA
jgi:diguanylate cyclase (GGDEF)-like protein/PAS domain S-box-containing protein